MTKRSFGIQELVERYRLTPFQRAQLIHATQRIYRFGATRRQLENALDNLNAALGGHGVEAIRGPHFESGYWADIVALYVNMGDTYALTFVYDVELGMLFVTSWGDWVEAYEARTGETLP